MYSRVCFSALATVAGFLALSSHSSAQTTNIDRGWLPWQGCWRAEGASEAEKLCIVPDGAGVKLITLEGAAVRGESRIVTDGRARAVNQEGCTGTELAHWSADGQRVFLTSDLSCEGGARRRVSGIFAMSGTSEWVSAQAVTIGDQTAARSVRYFAVPSGNLPVAIANALPSSRSIASAREEMRIVVDADDITEAVSRVDAAAVEEWLTVTGQPFQLADDLQPTQVTGGSVSALDMVSRGSNYDQDSYSTREVHVVEHPTVIHHTTYVNTVYRSCWDPWFAGYVTVTRGVYLGIGSNHYGHCGRSYYSRYSPWGYDLWGWRHVRRPIIIVRNNTPIIHRPPPPVDWNRDRGTISRNYDNRGTVTGVAVPRDGSTTSGTRGQVTRSGYSNGSTTRTTTTQPTQPSNSGSGSRYTQPASPRSSGGTTRTQVSSAGYTRTPRPAPPATTTRPTSQSESGYRTSQPSTESRGTAVPRGSSGSTRSTSSSSGGSRPSPSFRSSGSSTSSSQSPSVIRSTSTGRPESQATPVRAKPRGN